MKRVVKILVLAAAGFFTVKSASAQFVPNLGDNPALCQRHLALYQTDYQQAQQAVNQRQANANFDAPMINWRRVWEDCPLASPNLTPQGATMYKFYIDRELDQSRRNALIDTLVQVWEKGIALRAETPGVQAQYRTQLMQDMLRYADNPENEEKILNLLREMVNLQRRPGRTDRPTAGMYANYMRIRFSQNREGRISDEALIDDYNVLIDALSDDINQTNDEELARARDMIDDNFANSNAASRDNLLRIYGGRRYEENIDNLEYLRRVTRLLSQRDFTDSELYENAAERLYELNPSPSAAYNMATLFLRRDNFEKAMEYFEEAIRTETNAFEQARYNHILGTIMLTRYSRYTDAKRYAVEASRLRPDWAEPHILLANIYVSGPRCGNDDFEQRQVFWVAVDKLQTARRLDPDLASRIDPLIRDFSRHFPSREEGFFRNMTEGTNITIGCWINETTRVRFNN